jgi:hypothetical protein
MKKSRNFNPFLSVKGFSHRLTGFREKPSILQTLSQKREGRAGMLCAGVHRTAESASTRKARTVQEL